MANRIMMMSIPMSRIYDQATQLTQLPRHDHPSPWDSECSDNVDAFTRCHLRLRQPPVLSSGHTFRPLRVQGLEESLNSTTVRSHLSRLPIPTSPDRVEQTNNSQREGRRLRHVDQIHLTQDAAAGH